MTGITNALGVRKWIAMFTMCIYSTANITTASTTIAWVLCTPSAIMMLIRTDPFNENFDGQELDHPKYNGRSETGMLRLRPSDPSALPRSTSPDRFTNLLNDVKLEIMTYTTTDDLMVIMRLNRRLHSFVSHQLKVLTTRITRRELRRLNTDYNKLAAVVKMDFLSAFRHFDAYSGCYRAYSPDREDYCWTFAELWSASQDWRADRWGVRAAALALLWTQDHSEAWAGRSRSRRSRKAKAKSKGDFRVTMVRCIQKALDPSTSVDRAGEIFDKVYTLRPFGRNSTAKLESLGSDQYHDYVLGAEYFYWLTGPFGRFTVLDFGFKQLARLNTHAEISVMIYVPGWLIARLKTHWSSWYDGSAPGDTENMLVKAKVIEQIFLAIGF